MLQLSQISSPILKKYLLSRFENWNVEEKKATCSNCPKYPQDLKCCTFHPFLTNFSVGAIFKTSEDKTLKIKPSQFVVDVLTHKIKNREYTLPLGVFAPVTYQLAFHQRKEDDFGFNSHFLCPYFDKQLRQCGAWQFRGSVCTTYFCTSDHNEKGLEFWSVFGDYLHYLEMSLAQDCMVSLGLPEDLIDLQLEYVNCESASEEELKSSSMEPSLFDHHWRSWFDLNSHKNSTFVAEELAPVSLSLIINYYKECYDYVTSLDVSHLSQIFNDPQIKKFEKQIQKKTPFKI